MFCACIFTITHLYSHNLELSFCNSMMSSDKPRSPVEDQVKKIKWKSLKRLMKTKMSKQNDFKMSKIAASSAVKRPTRKRKTMECHLPTAFRVSRNPFSEAEEKGNSGVPMKWKSLKMLMKNGKKIMKWSKTSDLHGKKRIRNSKQSHLRILKKARSSAESPVTSMKRSTRKRKTIERYSSLWASASRAASKPFPCEKGNGTRLKDIPNVAYKLAQSKYDDNLQTLHTILFGRRTKVHASKNIGLFSGFVWGENEEKHRSKVEERIDKCVKNKLLELCDILDIPISNKSSTRKGDISAKILYFLEFPRARTESSIADKTVKQKISEGEQRKSSECRYYIEDEENESDDRMSDESDPDAWYNYKYGRHEDVEVDDDLWDTDPDTAWHLYKYGRRVFSTPW
nr:PREDICTED: uncharacterized protein LOC108195199 isoform X1 [Daucus carota subsp. sativus]